MYYRHYLLAIINVIVLSTMIQYVIGGSIFGDDTSTTKNMTTTTKASSANSLEVSWLAISSISMIVIGLINGHLRRFIF
uniref:MEG-32.1 protein n=1 Tax=Schistosoma mansoni TaxID=6183 RepID=A0A0U5KEW2_SCHMA|nr:TPA: MEG-32.1 protein [Schistosoma mansoni]